MELETEIRPTLSSRVQVRWERRYDLTPSPSGLSLLQTARCGELGQTQIVLDVQAFDAPD